MPTYRTTTGGNLLRTPSGAVNEAPDGPGALATLADDVESRFGWNGIESSSTTATRDGIAVGRKYVGKKIRVAADGITYAWNGSLWKPWDSDPVAFTPGINNWTAGNASSTGFYWYERGLMRAKFSFVFGSTSAAGGTPYLTLPNGATGNAGTWHVADGIITDVSAGLSFGVFGRLDTNAQRFGLFRQDTGAQVTAVAPFAWAVNDQIAVTVEAVLA